ncbi:hypothetical protein, partial [Litorisediminicola beolgyonensis]
MRWIALFLFWSGAAFAQSSTVGPRDVEITVTVAEADEIPFTQEMVLITIEGVYRRHVTREKLEQPDLDGFNWVQLGNDYWFESTENGQKVKNFRRRMALYPERAGTLEIGPFIHHLTLTDEGDDWFNHDFYSEPVTIEVAPAPPVPEGEWWFPVRQLRVADDWSNAPDLLKPGEGVLRVVRVEAVGVPPDMIPPMPELRSPSAMIFAHPEKRLVELSPEGPVSVAFWRWTIRPSGDVSAILEPIQFDYYDTRDRTPRRVVISAQRVAYDESTLGSAPPPPEPVALHPLAAALALGLGLLGGLTALLAGRRWGGRAALS